MSKAQGKFDFSVHHPLKFEIHNISLSCVNKCQVLNRTTAGYVITSKPLFF